MKRKILYIFIIVVSLIITGSQVVPFFFDSIIVQYQRSTGPDFIVLNGTEVLEKQISSSGNLSKKTVSYSELFASEDPEYSDYMKGSQKKFIMKCEIVNIRDGFPQIKIIKALPYTMFWCISAVFFLLIIFAFFIIRSVTASNRTNSR